MNTFVETTANRGGPPLVLRPEAPEDQQFLFTVYASTREKELALTNWDEATRRAFLKHQFDAMCRGYRAMFPAGEFSIILVAGQLIGRMVLDRRTAEIRVVDLALLPAWRNQGLGTLLMRQVCQEASMAGKSVTLEVLQNNRALHWYTRLGFTLNGRRGIYGTMVWHPGPADPAGA